MANEDPAPEAEEAEVAENQEAENQEEELNDDALAALAEGVDGTVTDNEDLTAEIADNVKPEDEAEETEEAGETAEEESSESDAPEEPEPEDEDRPAVADPGDFTPGDYSFEITTTDGKTVKISTPEDAEAFAQRLDDEEGLITASQFLQFNRKAAAMDIGIAADRDKYLAAKSAHEEQSAVDTAREESLKQWDSEITYLREKGDLPKLSDELNRADWTDPEIAKDPAVKATVELLHYMDAENSRRIDAGLEPMRSMLDAHTAMQLEAMKNDQKVTEDAEKKARQRRGSFIGSPAPSEPLGKPSGNIVGTGGTLDDMLSEFF